MKVSVLKEFVDRYTGELHAPGDVLEITEERYTEIEKVAHLVEKVAEEAPKPKKRTRKEAD